MIKKTSGRLETIIKKLFNLQRRAPYKNLEAVYLNASSPIKWKPGVYDPRFPGIIPLRTSEYSIHSLCFLNNSPREKATDLFIVFAEYTWRPSQYIIATLDWNTSIEKTANNLSLMFEQIKRNWRQNLFSDYHLEEREKALHTLEHSWVWTGLEIDPNVRFYVSYAKKSALKIANAYNFVVEHCEKYKTGNSEMFRTIANGFELVGKHKINLPLVSKEEKAKRKELYKSYMKSFPKSSYSDIVYHVDKLESLEKYEKIVPSQLAEVFLNTLNAFEPFKESGLTGIDPKSFYINLKCYDKK